MVADVDSAAAHADTLVLVVKPQDMAGLLGTVTLLTSAAGGLLFGFIADRIGRTRALIRFLRMFG